MNIKTLKYFFLSSAVITTFFGSILSAEQNHDHCLAETETFDAVCQGINGSLSSIRSAVYDSTLIREKNNEGNILGKVHAPHNEEYYCKINDNSATLKHEDADLKLYFDGNGKITKVCQIVPRRGEEELPESELKGCFVKPYCLPIYEAIGKMPELSFEIIDGEVIFLGKTIMQFVQETVEKTSSQTEVIESLREEIANLPSKTVDVLTEKLDEIKDYIKDSVLEGVEACIARSEQESSTGQKTYLSGFLAQLKLFKVEILENITNQNKEIASINEVNIRNFEQQTVEIREQINTLTTAFGGQINILTAEIREQINALTDDFKIINEQIHDEQTKKLSDECLALSFSTKESFCRVLGVDNKQDTLISRIGKMWPFNQSEIITASKQISSFLDKSFPMVHELNATRTLLYGAEGECGTEKSIKGYCSGCKKLIKAFSENAQLNNERDEQGYRILGGNLATILTKIEEIVNYTNRFVSFIKTTDIVKFYNLSHQTIKIVFGNSNLNSLSQSEDIKEYCNKIILSKENFGLYPWVKQIYKELESVENLTGDELTNKISVIYNLLDSKTQVEKLSKLGFTEYSYEYIIPSNYYHGTVTHIGILKSFCQDIEKATSTELLPAVAKELTEVKKLICENKKDVMENNGTLKRAICAFEDRVEDLITTYNILEQLGGRK